jgi:hypothetical protein
MYKPISTKTHGVLDYVTIGTLFALPRAMGWSRSLTDGLTALALGKLGYTLITRHELGLWRKLPMSAHLALDAASGAAMGAMPLMLGDEDDVGAQAACCALGTFEVLAATMTETSMPFPAEQTFEYRQETATAREHLENAGKERSILAGRPI